MKTHLARLQLRIFIVITALAILLSFFGFLYDQEDTLTKRGRYVYHTSCAPCHGKYGRGDGVIAANLIIKPRDLTKGVYENRSTMSGQLPTAQDLFTTLTNGIHSSPMPHFRSLYAEDRAAVVEYIRTLSPRFVDPDEYPLTILPESDAPALGPQSLGQGRKIYLTMKCGDCHGSTGKGGDEVVKVQLDEQGDPVETPDLTDADSYEFSFSPRDIYRILSTGLDGSPMPSYIATINEADRWSLAYYVWSLRNGLWYSNAMDTVVTK